MASWVGGKPPHSRAPGVDVQRDAALAGGRGLAQQQRDEHRLLDPLPQAAEQVLGGRGLAAGQLDRLLGAAELDQAGDHVQAVGGLVGLGAERVGQRLHRAELARERLDLGAVAERDHGADAAAVALDRAAGGQQDAVAGDQRRVVLELLRSERLEVVAEQALARGR